MNTASVVRTVQTEIGAKQGLETARISGTSLAMKRFTLDLPPSQWEDGFLINPTAGAREILVAS